MTGAAFKRALVVTMIGRCAILIVILAAAAPLAAQISSSAASVTLHARVEESVSARAFPVSLSDKSEGTAQSNLAALNVLLDWRLQPARNYRVSFGLERDGGPVQSGQPAEFFSLRQLEAKAAASSFMSVDSDQPAVMGVWGNTNSDPTGAASLLLTIPSREDTEEATIRITVAVF